MVPLAKSDDFTAPAWSKGSLTKELMELKKSGKEVEGLDFTKIDLGTDLNSIATKYGLN